MSNRVCAACGRVSVDKAGSRCYFCNSQDTMNLDFYYRQQAKEVVSDLGLKAKKPTQGDIVPTPSEGESNE